MRRRCALEGGGGGHDEGAGLDSSERGASRPWGRSSVSSTTEVETKKRMTRVRLYEMRSEMDMNVMHQQQKFITTSTMYVIMAKMPINSRRDVGPWVTTQGEEVLTSVTAR